MNLVDMNPKFFFFFLKILFIIYSVMFACQKRTAYLIIDGCLPPYGCWGLNSKPLESRSVLLTAEPSLQSPIFFLTLMYADCLKSHARDVCCASLFLYIGDNCRFGLISVWYYFQNKYASPSSKHITKLDIFIKQRGPHYRLLFRYLF